MYHKYNKPEELLIYQKKKNSLVNYYIEGNLRKLNRKYLKALQELLKEGYEISYIPKMINKLIAIDSTFVISVVLITALKIYTKLTKRKIEYI